MGALKEGKNKHNETDCYPMEINPSGIKIYMLNMKTEPPHSLTVEQSFLRKASTKDDITTLKPRISTKTRE